MSELLEALNDHYHATGKYPMIWISLDFAKEQADDITDMMLKGTMLFFKIDETQTEDWRIE